MSIMENNISFRTKRNWIQTLLSSSPLYPMITRLNDENGNCAFIFSDGDLIDGNTYDVYDDIEFKQYIGEIICHLSK